MKVTSDIGCTCGFKTKVRFNPPGFMGQVTGQFKCIGCESKLQYIIRRAKGASAASGKIQVGTNFLEVSDTLTSLILDAAKDKAASDGHVSP